MKFGKIFLLAASLLGAIACEGVKPDDPEIPDEEKTDVFEMKPTSVEVEADGGVVQVQVSGERSFQLSSWPEWVTEPTVKDRTVTLSVMYNDSGAERRGELVVSDEKGTSLTCVITQKAPPAIPVISNWDDPFPHKSLFYRFTATWCGWCPRMAQSVALAQEQNPDKFLLLNVHGYDSDLEFSKIKQLSELYKISGYPSGIVDGRREVQNYDNERTAATIAKYIQETEDNYPVSSRIAYQSSFKDRKLTINLFLFLRYAANYKVTVVLKEDKVIAPQANYEGSSTSTYEHMDVARVAVTNILGDALVVTQEKTMEQRTYSVTVPQEYDMDNLKIMVIVQRAFGDQKVLSGGYGDYYVDNCVEGKAGADLPL